MEPDGNNNAVVIFVAKVDGPLKYQLAVAKTTSGRGCCDRLKYRTSSSVTQLEFSPATAEER